MSRTERTAKSRRTLALTSILAVVAFALPAAHALAAEVHAFSTSFGEAGSGNGQLHLAEHSGVAVNQASGDVYVADTGNHRIEQFEGNGTFVRTFGTFTTPTFVAVDNDPSSPSFEDVYVADSATNAVSKFTANGTLVTSWATGGHLSGHGTKSFGELDGIAVNASGDLFVLGQEHLFDLSVMSVFGPEGTFVREFTLNNTNGPRGIALDNSGSISSGDIYAFYGGYPFEPLRFDPSGKQQLNFASGQVEASGIAVDFSNGDFYVDHLRDIARYDATGNPSVEPTIGLGAGIAFGQGLAVGPAHSVYVADSGRSEIVAFTVQEVEPPGASIEAATEISYTTAHVSGVVDTKGRSRSTVCRFEYVTEEVFTPGDEQQELTIAATGGTFQLAFEGQSTAAIAFDAPPAALEAALNALSTIGAVGASVTVTGGPGDDKGENPYTITFGGAFSKHDVPQIVPGSSESLIGTADTATTREGSPGGFFHAGQQPCVTTPSGSGSEPVEAELHGLETSTAYRFRLVATNPGGSTASPEPSPTFETKAVAPATVSINPVTAVTGTTAHFSGAINPGGIDPAFNVRWIFVCSPTCPSEATEIVADNVSHEVSRDVTNLLPGTAYEVTLVATNAGGSAQAPSGGEAPIKFITSTEAPRIDTTFPAAVSSEAAILNAGIDPRGALTTYHFEYLTEANFEADGEAFGTGTKSVPQPDATLGSGNEVLPASQEVSGLVPNTSYVFRVVASNEKSPPGGTAGPVSKFFTASSSLVDDCSNQSPREENSSTALPDCRSFERVSSTENADVYALVGPPLLEGVISQLLTNRPMQSSPDGDSITYAGGPPASGHGDGTGGAGLANSGDQHLASRAAGGWSAADIAPRGHGLNPEATTYQAFTDDLSTGILTVAGTEPQLSPEVEGRCQVLYSRPLPAGSYQPFFTGPDCGEPFFVGSSADGSKLLFESSAVMVPEAQEAVGSGHENIYLRSGGDLHIVNVLPGSNPEPIPDATAGSLAEEPDLSGEPRIPSVRTDDVISTDGAAAFWTDLTTGIVYVRENPAEAQSKVNKTGGCTQSTRACTVQVSAGTATYQTATPDGRYAYYLEAGELWRFDTREGSREALAAGSAADVQGVIGLNSVGEAGAYLYFVAEGALAPGAETRSCKPASVDGTATEEAEENEGKAPPGRGCNLYLLHDGDTTLVATLLAEDNHFAGEAGNGEGGHPRHGDWSPVLGHRSAQLTPDGHSLVFMSERSLTSYNTSRDGSCRLGKNTVRTCAEIYLYDSDAGAAAKISCVSCDPTGVPPAAPNGGTESIARGRTTYLPFAFSLTHLPRLISADGSRVFFDTDQPLVSADTNRMQDVYEWERQGAGSCVHGSPFNGGGCVYLISGGQGGEISSLIDADETGSNVFFTSRDQLVPGDRGGLVVLYDARVDGGFPAPKDVVRCGGEACRGPVSTLPPSPPPGTATFKAEEVSHKPKCRRSFVKKAGKCKKRSHGAHHKKAPHRKRPRGGNPNRRLAK